MIIFGLTILAFVVFLVWSFLRVPLHEYWWDPFPMTWIITFVVIIFMFIEVPKNREIEYSIAEYENLKEQAEGLTREDLVDLDILREEILSINNKIDRNKIYNNSPWCGVWFSEEIGNLQKLTYTGLRK